MQALEWGRQHGIYLDPTYTAKAMYALIDQELDIDVSQGAQHFSSTQPKNILFWHTLDEKALC